jgi:hypothetical protein
MISRKPLHRFSSSQVSLPDMLAATHAMLSGLGE